MDSGGGKEFEAAVVGGGLVGTAVAYGLARLGRRVAVLDEGDTGVRASRGNFALVWVQAKGMGMPEYAVWTVASSNAWPGFAEELGAEAGIDLHHQRPGGLHICLSEAEFEARRQLLMRFHNQAGVADYKTEMIERKRLAEMLPGLGPDVVGASYCSLDGHVNSLKLYRALLTGLKLRGAPYLPGHGVTAITRTGGVFSLMTEKGEVRADKVVLAAGNANKALAPMVGLHAPMVPERGQVLVTERVEPFLRYPISGVRQTDEGTVMIGASREDGSDPAGIKLGINSVMARRAMRIFPRLAGLNIVRSWAAVRVMPQDGFPIYDQSQSHPGAFVVTCHSGVTLAGAHATLLAPMIAAGSLDTSRVGAFSARRFNVRATA